MRLLIIHPRLNVLGGGERVAIHSIKEALREGHEVFLATEQFDIEAFEDFFGVQGLLDDVRLLLYSPFRPIVHRGVLYQRLIYNQAQLRDLLSKTPSFDLVLNTAEVANQPATKSPSIQYCYFPEYFSHLESDGSDIPWKLYYLPARLFYRSRVRRIRRLLAVSDFTKAIVKKTWGRDSTTLYPPCPIELYTDLHATKDNLVVTVGRVAPEKRIEVFLEIARRLPAVNFAIIGSVTGDRRSYYEKLNAALPQNASFVIAPLRKVRTVLARAKVYLHCAKDEHFGIAIVEAMAAGCVPVVHDSGGPREIVTDEVGFKWTSVDQAVARVSTMIENEELREKFSRAAISGSKRFSPEKFESGLEDVFRSFC